MTANESTNLEQQLPSSSSVEKRESEYERRREEYVLFMEEFMNESDRACIIVASANMESRLQTMLTTFLSLNKASAKELFSFNGPLGTLSSRLKLAYALRLIDKAFFSHLETFRKIRNDVVHHGASVSLTEPSINARVQSILSYFRQSKKFNRWATKIEKLNEDQKDFRYCLSFLALMIEHTTINLQPIINQSHSCDPELYIRSDKNCVS